MTSITCTPSNVLVDETPFIEVSGLKKSEPVTLVLYFQQEKKEYLSYAFYNADENGIVTNTKSECLGGYFEGNIILIEHL